ncbi:TMV resistance protein N-like isoform X2 [Vigna unguiculata]|uniref:TMV resistance protein N-like isoform X2 n=1 Tax=Vigna unguiculata TaxID=3917 RepID=UPI00101604BF|nr:TMV resistance protein N-like isoform X2 [Vigna unguiculata]XP_027908025.1 TMV resistance protein N-like isoform X2 [Vigna unguiculata]
MEFGSSSSSASSSSSFLKSEPVFIYDVFINFGGEDIGRRFVSHLHSSLLQAQVKTFISQENLQEGMKLEEHMGEIAASKIAIIVFSKTYAESTCCLFELEKKGDFGKALEEAAHKSYSGEQLEHVLFRWSCALTKAAGISGWDLRNFRHDAELVEVTVNRVQKLLDYQGLFITQFPIGLESHVEEVIGCIENHSTKVCMIGIWGMVGSGKTTIAKAIYNRIYRPFIGKSFIENIGEVWDQVYRTHVDLQENFLYDVLKSKLKLESVGMGRTMIKNELSRRKLLIVLDDVNEFGQLENLCGNPEWFSQGTVIIITTRDVRLLKRIEVNYVYKMDGMNENDSLELFCCHAFGEARTRNLNEIARNRVSYCGGLPLALEVLGSFSCKKTMREWESVLSKVKLIPLEVEKKLKLSFDGLNKEEMDIFLDVCCFFIGKERGYVTEILNGCELHADIGITVLIECGLIKFGRNNKLEMHPLFRDMGREYICQRFLKEPWKRKRLGFQGDAKYVLKKNIGTEATEGLFLKMHSTSRDYFEAHAFKKMKRLRLLQLDHVQLAGDYGYLSKQLRWICWKGFPSKYIPNNFHMENLIAMDLKYSNLLLVWKQSQVLEQLKFLNLSHSKYLRETPDFSGLPSLERLILKDCPCLCKVHPSIGDLCNLQLINLKDCASLSNIPREVYKLKSLKSFILSGCFKIEILEEDIVQMKSLITLVTENTAVRRVPCSVVSSKSIGYISLRGFEGLSQNLFPSIIRSWMRPMVNPQSYFSPFCMDMDNNNWRDLAPLHSGLANIRSLLVQCDTTFQLSEQVKTILVEYSLNFTEQRISNHYLRFSLIGVGSYSEFLNTLSDSISKGLASSESCDVCLPGDNHPYWLAHIGEGRSVSFTVPQERDLKRMALCVVYLSAPEFMANECFQSVLVVNYTKCTLQIHNHGTVISFNDRDWEGIISNLGSGDKVEFFVTFGHGLVVKNTAIYLNIW